MVKTKKTFIDRKNAVKFHLVHRSQHDPLVVDETAPQHVLVEAAEKQQATSSTQKTGDESATTSAKATRTEQLKKFGVFFDDDYDYLQHLKEPGRDEIVWECVETPTQQKKNKPKIQLPSSVFESEFEEEVGMLNKAAPRPGPRPDWDPDVVAALDEDFDFDNPENALEDDFVSQAMGTADDDDDDCIDEEDDEDYSDVSSDGLMVSDDENDDEFMDRLAPLLRNKQFSDEETKSRFTEYSMSSSVTTRNAQLLLLDDRFEKFFERYDDPEVGPLDMEDIEGFMGQKHPLVKQCMAEFNKCKEYEQYSKDWDQKRIEKYRETHDGFDDEELIKMEVEDDKQKKWDCESILSTYSNIYNHPKLIKEPRRNKSHKIEIDPKTGIPMNVLKGNDSDKLTIKSLAKFDNENAKNLEVASGPKSLCSKSVLSTLSILSIRPKDESPEEKKERKRLLKDYRQERRIERKANSEAFKEEKKRQTKIKINNQNNIQGNRIL